MKKSKLYKWIKVIAPIIAYMLSHIIIKNILIYANLIKKENVNSITSMILLVIVCTIYIFVNRKFKVERKENFKSFCKNIFEILIISVVIGVLSNFLIEMFNKNNISNSFKLLDSITIIIVAPILEEIIYRGISLKNSLKYFEKNFSVILIGILFGIAHLNSIIEIIIAIVVGVILNLIYLKYNNLFYNILIHSLLNLFSFGIYF